MPKKMKNQLPVLDMGDVSIGSRIASVRKKRGFTQTQLAEEIGITQSLVSDYETGRLHLNDEMIIRFSLALKASSDELLGIKNSGDQTEHSLKIIRRLKRLEQLSDYQQKTILQSLDLMIDSAERKT